jgi:hypothetical protein
VLAWTSIPKHFRDPARLAKKPATQRLLSIAIAMAGWSIGAAGLMGIAATAAQTPAPTTVERTAKGPTAKSIQVGLFLNVQPDCTSGPLPAIRMVEAPANGSITIKQAKVRATNYKQCLALEVPGFVAFYQSKPNFSGTDLAVIEIKYPQGRTELQRITINVGAGIGPGGQKI